MFKTMVLALSLFGCFATTAFAQGAKASKGPDMTAEQRQKMADAHEKMAACLRSDRPIADCHDELMKSCQAAMGSDACPMMGGKMGGMKHHGKMMQPGQTQ